MRGGNRGCLSPDTQSIDGIYSTKDYQKHGLMFLASILTNLQTGLRTPASADAWEQYEPWTPASKLECKGSSLGKDSGEEMLA